MHWRGPYHDADEGRWTRELDQALTARRAQRLRLAVAGASLPDFWTDATTAAATFSQMHAFLSPGQWPYDASFSGVTHVPGLTWGLLTVEETTDVNVALFVSPATGRHAAPCWARVDRIDDQEGRWRASGLIVSTEHHVGTATARLACGVFRVRVWSATELGEHPTFAHFTLSVAAKGPVHLSSASDVSPDATSVAHGRPIRATTAATPLAAMRAGTWDVGARLRVNLTADAGTDTDAGAVVWPVIEAHDRAVQPSLRAHLVHDETCEARVVRALDAAAVSDLKAGLYTLVVHGIPPGDADPGAITTTMLAAGVTPTISAEAVGPVAEASGRYCPSYAQTWTGNYELLRFSLAAAAAGAKGHAAVHLQLGDGTCGVSMHAFREGEDVPFASACGQGTCLLPAVPLVPGEGTKGAVAGRGVTISAVLEATEVRRLGLVRQPRAPEPDPLAPLAVLRDSAPPHATDDDDALHTGLDYTLRAAGAGPIVLIPDTTEAHRLEGVVAGWEASAPGRGARGRASRAAFLERNHLVTREAAEAMTAEATAAAAAKSTKSKPPGAGKGSSRGTPTAPLDQERALSRQVSASRAPQPPPCPAPTLSARRVRAPVRRACGGHR